MKKLNLLLILCVLFIFTSTGFGVDHPVYDGEIFSGVDFNSLTPEEAAAMEDDYYRNLGQDELDRMGGPDGYGYYFVDSEEDLCPDFEWVDLQNNRDATQVNLTYNMSTGPFEIGFDFPFYGEDKTQIWMSSSGRVGFTTNYLYYTGYQHIPYANYMEDMISMFGGAANCQYNSPCFYMQDEWEDGREVFIAEYNDVPRTGQQNNGADYRISCEVILFDDGEIRIQYDDVGRTYLQYYVIGIESAGSTDGLEYLYCDGALFPESGDVISFMIPASFEDASASGYVTNTMNGLPIVGAVVDINGSSVETDEEGYYEMAVDLAFDEFPTPVTVTVDNFGPLSTTLLFEEGANEFDFELSQLPFWFEMYSCDFEDDDGGWVGTGEWEWSGGDGVGALYYYYGPPHSGDYVWVTDTDATTGPYLAPNGQTMTSGDSYLLPEAGAYFSYWYSMYDYYSYGGHQAQISTDFGDSWEQIVPDGGYPYDGSYSANNQWDPGQGYFGGYNYQTFAFANFDLTDYAGEEVMFRIEHRCWQADYYGPCVDDVAFPVQAMQLTGQVTDSETGDPIVGAYVRCWEAEMDEELYTVVTDEEGMYSAPIYAGDFELEVWNAAYWPTWVEDVEVGDEGGEQDIEMVVIAENTNEIIQTELMPGDFTIATGIVTQGSNTTTCECTEFYIQDESGYGVMIYDPDPMEMAFNRGDSLWIRGRVEEMNNITMIVDFEYEVISIDNDMPEATLMTTDEVREGLAMEGSWVCVLGELQTDPVEDGSYSIYLDDGSGQVESRIWENTCINLRLYEDSEWLHLQGVISYFEGRVRMVPSMQYDIWTTPVYAPEELVGAITVNEESEIPEEWFADVEIEWSHVTPAEPEAEELLYDDDDPDEAIAEVGTVYGVQFTADENRGGQLLELRYYTILNEGENTFTAGIYGWDDGAGAPGDEGMMYPGVVAEDEAWTSLDVTAENIYFRAGEDWVIAFGCDFETVMLGHDTDDDDGRSFRGTDRGWFEDDGAYFVRALVIYETGEQALIGPDNNELDELIEFVVYRDGEELARTTEMTYSDHIEVPLEGDDTYMWEYYVTAVFDEGETDPTDTFTAEWVLNGVSTREFDGIPVEWDIAAAYPNPFNPMVNVVVAVPMLAGVKAEIVNVLGRRVALLQDGKLQPGYHKMHWNATSYPSGLYFMRVTSSTGFNQIQKLMYVK
ncbi:MAG: carboxypeptidase regulatory-like domain-containing protein [Candidatus Electryonea clarkiae]|nr:carboxypeptidase regulatory-like domain-containing protein [Candidatus Electryonea clarkiae]MDP8285134.1 carboxypeptidase regulatory-like domain-containing protein [Candidatus Electryonea clarkiae]